MLKMRDQGALPNATLERIHGIHREVGGSRTHLVFGSIETGDPSLRNKPFPIPSDSYLLSSKCTWARLARLPTPRDRDDHGPLSLLQPNLPPFQTLDVAAE